MLLLIFFGFCDISQEVTDSILRDLRLLQWNIEIGIKDVLETCKSDEGLSKAEIKNDKEWLKPLVRAFGKKNELLCNCACRQQRG